MMWRGFGPGNCGWGGGGPATILMIVFWVVVVGLIIFALTRMGRHGYHGHHWNSTANLDALEIAKERYARGEINEKEFEEIKKNLS
jgi:putative membrane protein